jgi:GTPase SAR1 family protein
MEIPRGEAESLREAIPRLDPRKPLETPGEMKDFFIERPNSPVDEIKLFLELATEPEKILFSGHRGSGKTTELIRLTQELSETHIPIRFSIQKILDPFDLKYIDVLLSIGFQLFDLAAQTDLDLEDGLRDDLIRNVLHFAEDITKEVFEQDTSGKTAVASLQYLLGKVTGKISTEDTTRKTIRIKIQPRLSELIQTIEDVVVAIEQATGKRILVVVEDLDKADLATVKEMFFEHSASLIRPRVTIIYTFPIALRFDNAFMQIKNNFSEDYPLSNIKTETRDGEDFPAGIDTMVEIIRRRMDADLLTDKAAVKMAKLSSGVPREFIRIARQATLSAVLAKKDTVDVASVDEAITDQRKDFDRLLSQAQRDHLRKIQKTKDVDNTEESRVLLHNLSVLEYSNDDIWYDVHPVVRQLLNKA